MIEVREAEPQHRPETALLARRVNEGIRKVYQVRSDARWNRSGRRERVQLVATLDEAVIGAASLAHHGQRVHLVGLYVDPNYKGRGVAGRLVEAAAGLARERGARRLTLATMRETGNVPLFERLGFQVVEEHETETVQGAAGTALREAFMERLL